MVKNPDISIIIVNYNVKDFLRACLQSIREATGNLSIETIVVDNNSVDGSVDYLRPQFPEVEFIALPENIGFARANNIGIEKARGRYLLILNPDTLLRNDTLQVMHDFMETHTDCGIAGCKVLNPDGSFQVACRRGFPTPWVAFSKLFGLQSLFPNSPIFARYNQLYKSIDDTYEVDAVIGAFMFCRTDLIKKIGGFAPEFFMYGEDLDLCRQVKLQGWKVMYVHTTSIIHYKGESTKRSSINDVRHFYEAMEIFTRKHFGKNHLFLLLLRLGIKIRSAIAYIERYWRDFLFILLDLLSINLALLISTKIRFEKFFGFPDYAYPIVFIVISLVFLSSMFIVGEYFEGKHSIKRAFSASMITFFVLSSLTYFFPEFRFSRGVVLMSIGFTIVFTSISRAITKILEQFSEQNKSKRIIIVGTGEIAKSLFDKISELPNSNIIIDGFVASSADELNNPNLQIIGEKSYLNKIIKEKRPNEVIFADEQISSSEMINLMLEFSSQNVRFHQVKEFDELLAASVIQDIADIEPTVPFYNLSRFRNKALKRIEDISVSLFLLTFGLPFIFILRKEPFLFIKMLIRVLKGEISFIGLHKISDDFTPAIGKIGIIGPNASEQTHNLSIEAIKKLNEYYLRHYTLSMDFDIIIKYLFGKNK
ncbi:MAG TPA: glycosyltransferase [Candidatus Kapabacteria bacterium]|nr:glycosyltransferase [Candidatus Kapabacteria bacterium]